MNFNRYYSTLKPKTNGIFHQKQFVFQTPVERSYGYESLPVGFSSNAKSLWEVVRYKTFSIERFWQKVYFAC